MDHRFIAGLAYVGVWLLFGWGTFAVYKLRSCK